MGEQEDRGRRGRREDQRALHATHRSAHREAPATQHEPRCSGYLDRRSAGAEARDHPSAVEVAASISFAKHEQQKIHGKTASPGRIHFRDSKSGRGHIRYRRNEVTISRNISNEPDRTGRKRSNKVPPPPHLSNVAPVKRIEHVGDDGSAWGQMRIEYPKNGTKITNMIQDSEVRCHSGERANLFEL